MVAGWYVTEHSPWEKSSLEHDLSPPAVAKISWMNHLLKRSSFLLPLIVPASPVLHGGHPSMLLLSKVPAPQVQPCTPSWPRQALPTALPGQHPGTAWHASWACLWMADKPALIQTPMPCVAPCKCHLTGPMQGIARAGGMQGEGSRSVNSGDLEAA